jgi:hypothetical protein
MIFLQETTFVLLNLKFWRSNERRELKKSYYGRWDWSYWEKQNMKASWHTSRQRNYQCEVDLQDKIQWKLLNSKKQNNASCKRVFTAARSWFSWNFCSCCSVRNNESSNFFRISKWLVIVPTWCQISLLKWRGERRGVCWLSNLNDLSSKEKKKKHTSW